MRVFGFCLTALITSLLVLQWEKKFSKLTSLEGSKLPSRSLFRSRFQMLLETRKSVCASNALDAEILSPRPFKLHFGFMYFSLVVAESHISFVLIFLPFSAMMYLFEFFYRMKSFLRSFWYLAHHYFSCKESHFSHLYGKAGPWDDL